MPATPKYQRVILFDGVCNLCNGFVRFIIRHDRKKIICFAALQSSASKELLSAYSLDPGHADSVVYIRNGAACTKSCAAINILYDLGGVWRVALMLKIIPRRLSDLIYDRIASKRYRWYGKKVTCMVPTEDVRDRFIGM